MINQTNISLKWHHFAAIALSVFTFFMSGLVSERVFERIPHLEDELAYLYQARVFAGGQLVVDSPQPTTAYWQPFVVDSITTGNRFGKYTPGYPAILAIGVLLGQTWVINAFLGMLAVALVYRLGSEIFNPDVGVIAALLTAFSPMALLLNGTLMSHSAGLFLATLFIYAYWRLELGQRRYQWGLIAGAALGLLASTRPLTSLGIGLPLIAWSGVRLLHSLLISDNRSVLLSRLNQQLPPLLVLSVVALLFVSSIPVFSYVATSDPQQNLYELVWDYDRIGFGEGHGRNRHRLEKAYNHARFDLSLTAADLFGWQFEPINDDMIHHLQNEAGTYPATGYSFILLPIGLLIGILAVKDRDFRLRLGIMLSWGMIAIFWGWMPGNLTTPILGNQTLSTLLSIDPTIVGDETFSWVWIITALLWLYLPMFYFVTYKKTLQIPYTWIIFSVMMSVIVVQMLYWIGSQRYSTRYYYEALTMASLLTAIPFAWGIRQLIKKARGSSTTIRLVSYVGLLAFCVFTLYFYSTPRIMALYQFNGITPELIEQVDARRDGDQPILVIVNGATSGEDRVRWRSYGALMAVTDPYFNNDIIVARDYGTYRESLIAQHPNRQVIDVFAIGNEAFIQDPYSGGAP